MKLLAIPALLLSLCGACLAAAPAGGLDTTSFNPAVRAQDDWFRAANGAWLEATPIPAGKSYVIGVEVNDINDARIRAIVDDMAARSHKSGSIEQKVGDFYASFLDTPTIDKIGMAPATNLLAEVDALRTPAQLAAWQGKMHGLIEMPVWLRVFPDLKNPRLNRVMTWQGGLGMPDREYYLQQDESKQKVRAAYRNYLATLARLAGIADPEGAAGRVIALETRIASTHWKREELGDMVRLYNPMTPAALAASAPGFDWAAYLKAAALPELESITVTQASTATATAALYAQLPLADWKLYFKLRLLDAAAPVLPHAVREAHFAYRGRALAGAIQAEPRWQQAIVSLNGALGEGVGRLYVQRHFPAAHKVKVQAMVSNILAAYRESIEEISWMTPATKAQALDKLSRYGSKIGYPDKWRDYGSLRIAAGDALGNRVRAARFNWEQQARKADRAVDRGEWHFLPQTVDAMYDPMLNEIVFPAATLQKPFFDIDADDAVNYGAIGINIGHEISHGFDSGGSQFDGNGVLRNWWNDADRMAFDQLSARLVRQFDAYQPLPGKHVNGKLTLSENLADLSGMQVAYRAYRRSLGGKPSPLIDGLSGEQRFFLAAAQFRRVKMRDEALATMMATDVHAPHEYRANGPAVNTDGFHEAFATKPGDAMHRSEQDRIRLW